MISEDYRNQLIKLHEDNPKFGYAGFKWANIINNVVTSNKFSTVLDYGCGKGMLIKEMQERGCKAKITGYDPAVSEFNFPPPRAELVTCIDVLEHIEPYYLGDVLTHLAYLTEKMLVCVISTRPAKKTLPDGRNAHLIVRSEGWWLDMLNLHMVFINAEQTIEGFTVTCVPKTLSKIVKRET